MQSGLPEEAEEFGRKVPLIVDGCSSSMVRTIELQRDLLLANAGAAAAVGRAAPPWQLALGTLIAGFLIYHHGRAMAWMALSLSLIL